MTRVIGLTGGIATGKSTVAEMFRQLGAVVLDADAIVREIQAPGTETLAEIAEAFGPEMIQPGGALDRERLGALVFRNEEARGRVNAIVHPRVGAAMATRLAEAREAGVPLVLLDIPLLFETRARGGSGALVEATILVYAAPETQIERQLKRDGRNRQEALDRMAAQMPIDDKRALADHVIENGGTLEACEAQVERLWHELVGSDTPAERSGTHA